MLKNIIKEKIGVEVDYFSDYLSKINVLWFDKIKLEKDFYLTIILNRIADDLPDLIFKWWTCLNKVHFGYYRLSEDLDFVVLTDSGDYVREKMLKMYKKKISEFMETLWCQIQEGRTRFNSNIQGMYRFFYKSFINGSEQEIKIDIHLQKNLMNKTQKLPIKHIFIHPLTSESIFESKHINCMHLDEAMAEKMRAWLTRKEPAIRDFFDVRHTKNQWYDFHKIKDLIHKKVEEAGKIYTLEPHYDKLKKQIDTDLQPVLGNTMWDFDFDQIYAYILSFKH